MLLTEKQARASWCPFSRVAGGAEQHYVPVNRLTPDGHYDRNGNHHSSPAYGSRCLATDCMAWRFAPPTEPEGVADLGYCGLAGEP